MGFRSQKAGGMPVTVLEFLRYPVFFSSTFAMLRAPSFYTVVGNGPGRSRRSAFPLLWLWSVDGSKEMCPFMKRLCETCEHFSPAHTCIEKPTWGHCMRLVCGRLAGKAEKGSPVFTWADSLCDDYRPNQPTPVRR